MGAIGPTLAGASAGASVGGPVGAVIGGIVGLAAGFALRPKDARSVQRDPREFGDFAVPTLGRNLRVPVLFGHQKISGNLIFKGKTWITKRIVATEEVSLGKSSSVTDIEKAFYNSTFCMALGEGPFRDLPRAFRDEIDITVDMAKSPPFTGHKLVWHDGSETTHDPGLDEALINDPVPWLHTCYVTWNGEVGEVDQFPLLSWEANGFDYKIFFDSQITPSYGHSGLPATSNSNNLRVTYESEQDRIYLWDATGADTSVYRFDRFGNGLESINTISAPTAINLGSVRIAYGFARRDKLVVIGQKSGVPFIAAVTWSRAAGPAYWKYDFLPNTGSQYEKQALGFHFDSQTGRLFTVHGTTDSSTNIYAMMIEVEDWLDGTAIGSAVTKHTITAYTGKIKDGYAGICYDNYRDVVGIAVSYYTTSPTVATDQRELYVEMPFRAFGSGSTSLEKTRTISGAGGAADPIPSSQDGRVIRCIGIFGDVMQVFYRTRDANPTPNVWSWELTVSEGDLYASEWDVTQVSGSESAREPGEFYETRFMTWNEQIGKFFWIDHDNLTGSPVTIPYMVCHTSWGGKDWSWLSDRDDDAEGKKELRFMLWEDDDLPAAAIYAFLRNSRFGVGIPANRINTGKFERVQYVCSRKIRQNDPKSPRAYDAQYRLGINLAEPKEWPDHVDEMSFVFGGFLFFHNGEFKLDCERPIRRPVYHFNDRNMIEQSFGHGYLNDFRDVPNQIEITLYDAFDNYRQDTAELPNQHAIASTGDLRALQLTSIGLIRREQAYRLCNSILENAHVNQRTCRWKCSEPALLLEPGDVVTVTTDQTGGTKEEPRWDHKLVRIVKITENDDGEYTIFANEYDPDIYERFDWAYQDADLGVSGIPKTGDPVSPPCRFHAWSRGVDSKIQLACSVAAVTNFQPGPFSGARVQVRIGSIGGVFQAESSTNPFIDVTVIGSTASALGFKLTADTVANIVDLSTTEVGSYTFVGTLESPDLAGSLRMVSETEGEGGGIGDGVVVSRADEQIGYEDLSVTTGTFTIKTSRSGAALGEDGTAKARHPAYRRTGMAVLNVINAAQGATGPPSNRAEGSIDITSIVGVDDATNVEVFSRAPYTPAPDLDFDTDQIRGIIDGSPGSLRYFATLQGLIIRRRGDLNGGDADSDDNVDETQIFGPNSIWVGCVQKFNAIRVYWDVNASEDLGLMLHIMDEGGPIKHMGTMVDGTSSFRITAASEREHWITWDIPSDQINSGATDTQTAATWTRGGTMLVDATPRYWVRLTRTQKSRQGTVAPKIRYMECWKLPKIVFLHNAGQRTWDPPATMFGQDLMFRAIALSPNGRPSTESYPGMEPYVP